MNAQELHSILSRLPYGEAQEVLLSLSKTNELITSSLSSMEVLLELPWTSQLRLGLFLPTVYQKVKALEEARQNHDDDDAYNGAESVLLPDDVMLQQWNVTRYFMLRDHQSNHKTNNNCHCHPSERESSRWLLPIIQRIDKLLGYTAIPSDPSATADGSSSSTIDAEDCAPYQIMAKKYNLDEQQQQSSLQQQRQRPIHPNFATALRNNNKHQVEPNLLRRLCRVVGADGTKQFYRRVKQQLEQLPQPALTKGLVVLNCDNNDDDAAEEPCQMLESKRGRALLLSVLPPHLFSSIPFTPLPDAMLYNYHNNNDSSLIELAIEKYLRTAKTPNVNALVLHVWNMITTTTTITPSPTTTRSKRQWNRQTSNKTTISQEILMWLPIEPILSSWRARRTATTTMTMMQQQQQQQHPFLQYYNKENHEIIIDFLCSLRPTKEDIRVLFGSSIVIPQGLSTSITRVSSATKSTLISSSATMAQFLKQSLLYEKNESTQSSSTSSLKRQRTQDSKRSDFNSQDIVQQAWGKDDDLASAIHTTINKTIAATPPTTNNITATKDADEDSLDESNDCILLL